MHGLPRHSGTLALSFALALSALPSGCGEGVATATGGYCLFTSCEDQGYTATAPTTAEAPHDYIANIYLPGELEAVGFVLQSSNPLPEFAGEHTWTVILDTETPGGSKALDLVAEPMMPAHGHGTLPQYTEGSPDEQGAFVLPSMNLYMPGVWEIRLTARDADGTLVDAASYYFELE